MSIYLVNQNVHQRLFQVKPRRKSRLPKGWRSKTESEESFRRDAIREKKRLEINGTIPNHIIHLNYLTVLSVKEIKRLWTKHSRRLYKAGVIAWISIEITKGKDRKRAVNRVHYHIVAKDDRTHAEMKELFIAVCKCEMKESHFEVSVFPFNKKKHGGWQGYIGYLVKLRNQGRKHYLFRKGLKVRIYYVINKEKFWTYPDSTSRSIGSIDAEIQCFAKIRKRLKKFEKIIPLKDEGRYTEDPADQVRLKELLDKQSEKVLYDWYSALIGKPMVFGTALPRWFVKSISSQPYKWCDLLEATENRIRNSKNPDIIYALKIYHDFRQWSADSIAILKVSPDNTHYVKAY